jgi:hypothetical protein
MRDGSILAALSGKRVNDTFSFTGRTEDDTRCGKVRQVRCKELKLLHEVLDHLRTQPRAGAKIWTVKGDLDSMLKEIRLGTEGRSQIIAAYREKPWPAAWLAQALGHPIVETYWLLLQENTLPLRAFPGVSSLQKQEAIAAGDSPFILDVQAIQLATRFDLLRLLQNLAPHCFVCQSGVDAVSNAAQLAKMRQPSQMSVAIDPLGGVQINRSTAAEESAYREHLNQVEAFIERLPQSHILGAPSARTLPSEAMDVLGRNVVDMIELSRERNLPALIGDWSLAGLFQAGSSASFRTIIQHELRQGRVTAGDVAKALGYMKVAGVEYISVSEEILKAAGEILLVHDNPRPFTALFSQLSPDNSDPQGALPILARCLRHFSILGSLPNPLRQQLVSSALTAAFGSKRHMGHLQSLKLLVTNELRLAPEHQEHTLATIAAWEKTLNSMSA